MGDLDWRWLLAPEENSGTAAVAPGRSEFRGYGRSKTPGAHEDLDSPQPASARGAPSAILRPRGAVVLLALCALLIAAIAVPLIAFKGDASRNRALPDFTAPGGPNASQQSSAGSQSSTSTAPLPATVRAATPRAASQSQLMVELPRGSSLRPGQ